MKSDRLNPSNIKISLSFCFDIMMIWPHQKNPNFEIPSQHHIETKYQPFLEKYLPGATEITVEIYDLVNLDDTTDNDNNDDNDNDVIVID